jgi:multiple sugar transport system permease protein
MMIPSQMSLIGLFQLSKKLGILNTYVPLILPAFANASTVFFLKGTFDENLPLSLLEAARMEGMGEFRIFNTIAFPLCQVGIATISIFNFVNIWNNYLNPLTLLNQKGKYPLSIGIAILRRTDPADLGAVYLGLMISVIPILLIYSFCSKFIIGGMLEGSVKG